MSSKQLAFRVRDLVGVATARILGRSTSGSGRAEELTASQVRTLLSVSATSEIAAAYQPIGDYATLVGGIVPAGQLPSYVDDVIEGANLAAFPATGESGKIYVALDTGRTYRWSGSVYVELTDSTAVWGSISGTLSNQTDLQTAINGKANSSHTHAASEIVSGTIATARLGSGTASSSTYLRGDQTWATVTAGVSGSTGSTDNALLRADGTGGATLQASNIIVSDAGNITFPAAVIATGVAWTGKTYYQDGFVNVGWGLSAGNWYFGNGPSDWKFGLHTSNGVQVYSGTLGFNSNSPGSPSDTGLSRNAAGVLEINTGTVGTFRDLQLRNLTASAVIGLGVYTVATLPSAAANPRRIAAVTDSSVTANGSAVAGGGSNVVMVFSNGTNWDVVVA